MLVAERYDQIVRLVNERGSIRVTELSELCGVTEETIRRDLDRLEQDGKLRRTHGGAVSLRSEQQETPYAEREVTQAEEKKSIAKWAVNYVEPGDRIILDASTTAWYMATHLPNLPLTVLTNSIRVATVLSTKERVQVISTGGILAQRSLSFVGPLAERSLGTYHVDKAFISCKGVHLERGLSESNELQGLLKKKMIDIAERVFLLVDHSKFGVQSFSHIADLEQMDHIITDYQANPEVVRTLQERAIPVSLAE